MTILRHIRHFILSAMFILPLSAANNVAAQEVGDPSVVVPCLLSFGAPCYDGSVSSNLIKLRQRLVDVIIGGTGTGTGQKMLPATDIKGQPLAQENFRNGGQYKSLTEYYENVWWPRFLAANQIQSNQEAQTTAVTESAENRRVDAKSLQDWDLKVKELNAKYQDEALLVEEVVCGPASVIQSIAAAEAIANDNWAMMDQMAAIKRSGDPSGGANKGPVETAYQSVLETNTEGTCNPTGNDGANTSWCRNSSPEWVMGHVAASYALVDTAWEEKRRVVVRMLISRMFPNQFSSIRADLLNPLTKEAATVLNEQDSYNTRIGLFSTPMMRMIEDRTPQPGMAAVPYLNAALESAGYDAELREKILGPSGTMSLAGAERTVYQEFMRDPANLIKAAGDKPDNALRATLFPAMQQVTLLYQIREQQKMTNILLGAIGSVLIKDQYNTLQASTNRLANP
jgi:hypothetical protein